MIQELIKKENIVLKRHAKDWKEAVHISLENLVEGGYCTDQYEQGVLKNTAEYGPYYVLTEEFALVHCNDFASVNETQMAVTTLDEAIKFSEDGYDVRILVALVAVDGDKHLDGIRAISNIFADEDKVQEIIDATEPEKVLQMFIESAEEE